MTNPNDHGFTPPEDVNPDPEELVQAYAELKAATSYWNVPAGKNTRSAVDDAKDILREQIWETGSNSEMRFTAHEYATMLEWYMVSDPWPLTQRQDDTIREMLNEESRARGYKNWVVAYHEFIENGEVEQ